MRTPRGRRRWRPGGGRLFGAVCAVCWLAAGTAAGALEPAELLAQIRAPRLALDDAVALRNVQLDMGPGVLDIGQGIVFPGEPIDGTVVELVFIGQARFRLEPPDAIEAGQLELFTGERSLDAPVEEAVLVLANPEAVDELLRRPAPHEVRPELRERAARILAEWVDRPERRSAGVEAALFKLLVGDRAFERYFALWCSSFELGEFVYQLDPEEQEQVTLASFRPLELTQWERLRLKHELRVQQRKGRWLDVRVEDLGSWDVWLSTAWIPSAGPPLPGTVGFESEHYDLDVRLERGSLRLDGRAGIDLTVESGGRRVVRLELARDLSVDGVRDGRGRDLFFFRSGDEVSVLLPESPEVGADLRLEVAYSGRSVEWVARHSFDLVDGVLWYPHCGTVDRATYDVTLRWPRKLDLLSSGRLVERGREGRYAWERRRVDKPAIAVSFAVGRYVVDTRQVGDTTVILGLGRTPKANVSAELRQRTLDTVADALTYFEETFGEYPSDQLTLVTVPRKYSQSFSGFVTLAGSLIEYPDPVGDAAAWTRDTTIAHELAHQWWGNSVGWWSYRDQWLSEGMANYAALLYDGKRSGSHDRLAVMSAGWRESLSRTTLEGRTLESLGPVVLGSRLDSSRARNGYRTIVYRKGAVVLAMLARAVGEERFLQMLGSLADAAQHKVLTTETFLKALERMSGLDLAGFARQYVYGTGIPEVYYGYELDERPDGGWKVEGEARLLYEPHYRYQVVRGDTGWDIERRKWPREQSGETTLIVPYQVLLEGEKGAAPEPGERTRSQQTGQLALEGRADGFTIETEARPRELRLDPRGEILAWFYSARSHPKRFLHQEAEDLATSGEQTAAERRYLQALESPAEARAVDPLSATPPEDTVSGFVQDVRIRLALARLYLDQGRIAEAEQLLDRVDTEVEDSGRGVFRMQRDALRGRLEIVRGDYEGAFRRLRKTLRLASPRPVRVPWRDMILQLQLNTERDAVTEAYALLAIAAHETGNEETLAWALAECRSRKVDVSLLEPVAGE